MSTEMEDFKRPEHTDFMTTSELKKAEWSGVRNNSISEEVECWILGEIVFKSTVAEMLLNPNDFDNKYKNHFGFYNVKREGE